MKKRGISLIVLIVIIVIIVILTTTVMLTVINTGIIDNAKEAVILNTIGNIKEEIAFENQEIILNGGKVGTLEEKYVEGKVTRSVQELEEGSGKYYIYYVLSPNSYSAMGDLGKGTAASRKDVFVIDEYGNIKYINKKGKEYGDKVDEKILEDETHIRFKNKEFGDYVSRISGAKEEDMIFLWMKNQTYLEITDSTITSLEDLVFFPNLTGLEINGLILENLDGIENCTKLETLRIRNNKTVVKDYDNIRNVKSLKNFTIIGAQFNYDEIIDILKDIPNLISLTIRSGITDLKNLGKLKNLESLDIKSNKCNFENIEEIGKCTKLKDIYISDNKIESIDFVKTLPDLRYLDATNNLISDITPLSQNDRLMTLKLLGNPNIDGNRENYTGERLEALNKIGEILDRNGVINVDIDKLGLFTNYKNLELSSQNLTTLEPLKGLINLVHLELSENKITLEDEESRNILRSMAKLEYLDLQNNNLTDISAINSLTRLNTLKLSGVNNNVNLSQIQDILKNNITLTVNKSQCETLKQCENKDLITSLKFNKSSLDILDINTFTNLTEFEANQTDIQNFENISNFINLNKLVIINNDFHEKLSNINFSNLRSLTYLKLDNNKLWSEDLESLKALRNNNNLQLYLQNNAIIDATALLELDPSTSIYLAGNVNLNDTSKEKLKERFGENVNF